MKNIPGNIIALVYLGIWLGVTVLLLLVGWRLIEVRDLYDWIGSWEWQSAEAERGDGTQYEFTAWNGLTYTGDRYHFLTQVGGNTIDEAYPSGETFTIFYDRFHPEKSVADRSETFLSIGYVLLRFWIWLAVAYLSAQFFFEIWNNHVRAYVVKPSREEKDTST
jgi:hypothetical protein